MWLKLSILFSCRVFFLRSIIDNLFPSYSLWFQSLLFFCCCAVVDCIINWHVNFFSNMSRSPFNHKLFKWQKERKSEFGRCEIATMTTHSDALTRLWVSLCTRMTSFIQGNRPINYRSTSSSFPPFTKKKKLSRIHPFKVGRVRLSSSCGRTFCSCPVTTIALCSSSPYTTQTKSIGWHNDLACGTHKSRRHGWEHRNKTWKSINVSATWIYATHSARLFLLRYKVSF